MTPLKLAIMSRRFWPMSDQGAVAVGEIGNRIQQRGHSVSAVTARWEKVWPGHFEFREFDVTRVTKPHSGPWGSFRFSRGVVRWMIENGPWDGVLVWGLGEDVMTIRRSILRAEISNGSAARIVARVDQAMLNGLADNSSTRKKIALLDQADVVLVDSPQTAQRLTEFGLPASVNVGVVPDPLGIEVGESPAPKTQTNQSSARMALADAHPILVSQAGEPLVVTGIEMDSDGGLFDLLAAWAIVIKTYPKARLWLLGDGKQARQIWELIEHHDLIYSAIMPGYFDDPSDVFVASDLYVHPARTCGHCNMLVRAMSRGTCPLATMTPFTEPLIRKNENGLLVPPGNPKAMAEAILHGLGNRDLRNRLGNAAMKINSGPFSLDSVTQQFLQALTGPLDLSADKTSSDSTAGRV